MTSGHHQHQLPPKDGGPILALDLGTQTGWALRQEDHSITSGTEPFKPQRFEGGGMRYLRFKRWLAEVHGLQANQNGLQAIFFEEVRRLPRPTRRTSTAASWAF